MSVYGPPYLGPGGSQPDPADIGPPADGSYRLVMGSKDAWAAIVRFVDARIRRVFADWVLNQGGISNIACTMGTPGTPAVASDKPWGFIVVPFPCIPQRIEYFAYPAGATYAVDIKVVRPGQTLASGTTLYPGVPPSFQDEVNRVLTGSGFAGFVEAGTVLGFYLIGASGGLEILSANVIVRTAS